MQLRIRSTPSSEDLSIRAEEIQTISFIRQIISKELEVPLDLFYLCYDQETLTDQNTLEDYGIQEGAVLYCVIKPNTHNAIHVRLDDGTNVEIPFQLTDTVQKIKRLIGEKAYGRRCQLLAFHHGAPLDDAKTMKDYSIKNKEEIFAFRAVA